MATFTVTTTSDLVDLSDGQLSLREALALADADPTIADTIDFAPAVQGGRIVLAGSQLTVNSDVTIDGGAGVTLDANHQSRVLLVQDGLSNANDVVLRGLTITGGLPQRITRVAVEFQQPPARTSRSPTRPSLRTPRQGPMHSAAALPGTTLL